MLKAWKCARTPTMTPDQLLHIARELRALGAVHVKVESLEVVFAPSADAAAPAYPAQRPLSEMELHVQAALGSS